MTVEMLAGDCLEALPALAESSVDSCVTDPPYHLTSIVKRFGGESAAPVIGHKTGAYGGGFKPEGNGTGAAFARMSRGFMGKQWDGGDIAFRPDVWREVWRVLKPGAHLLAFGGTRTYHRMACAIEDAGFEIRDCIMWVYGSGFPKSHDVSKGIDRGNGHWRGRAGEPTRSGDSFGQEYERTDKGDPITPAARQWQGWGTALKPACEPIVLARKPLSEGTVAANVLRWGTGAINVDGTRVSLDGDYKCGANGRPSQTGLGDNYDPAKANQNSNIGRWPANLIHDGSEEVLAGFPESDGGAAKEAGIGNGSSIFAGAGRSGFTIGDSGSAARFFYTAKADTDDRLGSKHPTVKPLDLMQYLVRLVTPKGGLVLDPFAGTGTTGEAAFREGCNAVLIEREAEYQADIKRRIAMLLGGPEERAREAIKERMKDKPRDDGPLFGGAAVDDRASGRAIYGVFADENGKPRA